MKPYTITGIDEYGKKRIAMLQAMMYSSFTGYDDFTGHSGRSIKIDFERVNIKSMSAKELGTSNGKKKSRAKRKRSRQ